jgi:hypothetical protein
MPTKFLSSCSFRVHRTSRLPPRLLRHLEPVVASLNKLSSQKKLKGLITEELRSMVLKLNDHCASKQSCGQVVGPHCATHVLNAKLKRSKVAISTPESAWVAYGGPTVVTFMTFAMEAGPQSDFITLFVSDMTHVRCRPSGKGQAMVRARAEPSGVLIDSQYGKHVHSSCCPGHNGVLQCPMCIQYKHVHA